MYIINQVYAMEVYVCQGCIEGGARGVIRPPLGTVFFFGRFIRTACYNSDDFAPPTFFNCPKRPPPPDLDAALRVHSTKSACMHALLV